jgi:RNA polymerase sigma factor (TIGR02999 family)
MGVVTQTITVLLRAWAEGDGAALDQLVPLVYSELHRLASLQLRGERPGHTFRPTDLVSEAYLKLTAGESATFNDRVHFFAVAASNMRRILIDHARKRGRVKRGAGEAPVELDEVIASNDRPAELIELDEALDALAETDARKARAIELHYYGGLSYDEVAQVLGVHENTVAADIRFGRAWMAKRLRDQR